MKQESFSNRGLLDWPPDPVRLAGQRAQIPRPPMPIPPTRGRPHAANHPPARSEPTPIPPPTPLAIPIPPQRPIPPPTPAMMPVPSRVPLPPVEFDHPYAGKLTVLKEDHYALIRHVCSDTPNAIACSFRTYDSVSGETLSCLIMLGPRRTMMSVRCGMKWGIATAGQDDHPGAR